MALRDFTQSREEPHRIAAQYRCTLLLVQRRSVAQLGARSDDQVAAQVRIVGTVENLVDAGDGPEHLQDGVLPGERRVPVEATQGIGGRATLLVSGDDLHLVDDPE